jgi:hypothetical protein
MEYKEVKTIIYDDNGYKETIIEMVPDVPPLSIDELIKSKEEQLLELYAELQVLKEKQ